MQFSNNILLIIWVLIAIPSIVFTQKKSKAVCNRECPSGYICGFGEMDDNSSNDKANVKKIAVNHARTEFASTIITFVESNSELNIKEQDGNAEEAVKGLREKSEDLKKKVKKVIKDKTP